MKNTLYFAPLDFQGDIPEFNFKSLFHLVSHLQSVNYIQKRVFVFSYNKPNQFDETEVIITQNIEVIINFILDNEKKKLKLEKYSQFFLQEYFSFEEAYKVALDFKEGTTNLCYDEEAQQLSFEKFDENLNF